MKFDIIFDSEQCKGCKICMEFCVKHLLVTDTSRLNQIGIHPAMIRDKEKCIGCGNCALMCPDAIITIEKLGD
jgi:2-oxoglutarate ferredoxin oxidoreductase subunit delta